MTLKLKRAALPAAGGLLVFVALAEWLLWLMPPPHGRLQHMIAGTAATAAALLGVAFARVVMRREGGDCPGQLREATERVLRGKGSI